MIAGPALISYGIDEGVVKGDVDVVTLAAVLFVVTALGAYGFGSRRDPECGADR